MRLFPLMEIAHKYQVDMITSRILKHIEADWPQALKEWDALEEQLRKVHINSRDNLELRKKALPEPISAINFARRFHAENILPAAFQLLSRTRYSDNWDELDLLNGVYFRDLVKFERFARTKRARWSLLSTEDHLFLGKIHDNVKDFVEDQAFEYLTEEIFLRCENSLHDREEMKLLRADIRDCLRSARDVFDAISEYCDGAGERRRKFTFCKPCYDYIQDKMLLRIRFRLWKVVKDTGEKATHIADVLDLTSLTCFPVVLNIT